MNEKMLKMEKMFEMTEKMFKRLKHLEEALGVEIVTYGLAPNPDGYCYETLKRSDRDHHLWDELDLLCDTAPEGFLETKY